MSWLLIFIKFLLKKNFKMSDWTIQMNFDVLLFLSNIKLKSYEEKTTLIFSIVVDKFGFCTNQL